MRVKPPKEQAEIKVGAYQPHRLGPWLCFGRYLPVEGKTPLEFHFDWREWRTVWARGGFTFMGNLWGFDGGVKFPFPETPESPVVAAILDRLIERRKADLKKSTSTVDEGVDDGSADATPPAE